MQLYNLGKVPWSTSQLIYHALARLGREALSLVSPASPYVCVGYHQDAEQEVDLAFCRANDIPVFRREVGGGAVYLDGDQLFFQLILRRDNPALPAGREAFYRKFLQPIIDVYRRLGIPAEFKPINDVVVDGRKISGTGVGEIGDCVVFVGNLILDFNYEMMSRVLKVPDEKFRDKIHKTIRANLSTIRRELGPEAAAAWDEPALNGLMAEEFSDLLGRFEPRGLDQELSAVMDRLAGRMLTQDWLLHPRRLIEGREVKVRAGVKVVQRVYKAPGGLIRADFELREGRVAGLALSGDFFVFPKEGLGQLEQALEGRTPEEIPAALSAFFARAAVEIPGVGLDDWRAVLAGS